MSEKSLYSFIGQPASSLIHDPGVKREILKLMVGMLGGFSATYLGNSGSFVFVDSRLVNKSVNAIIINDIVKNTGFTKSLSSNTLTFTDGTSINNNDAITIL